MGAALVIVCGTVALICVVMGLRERESAPTPLPPSIAKPRPNARPDRGRPLFLLVAFISLGIGIALAWLVSAWLGLPFLLFPLIVALG